MRYFPATVCPVCGEIHHADGAAVPSWVKHHMGLTDRQLSYWRVLGLLHVPGQGSGSHYPWIRLLPRVEWLRRIHAARHGLLGGTPGSTLLDYLDGKAGVDLIGQCDYAIRIGRDPWQPFEPDAANLPKLSDAYLLAAVPPANWLPAIEVAA